jgi:hypothetical protein
MDKIKKGKKIVVSVQQKKKNLKANVVRAQASANYYTTTLSAATNCCNCDKA